MKKIPSFVILLLSIGFFSSCSFPVANQMGPLDLSAYREVPVNRVRGDITYYNLNWIRSIRASDLSVEVMTDKTRSELEVTSNQLEYLRVMRHEDELFLFYDFPGTGPGSGFRKIDHTIRIYLNNPVTSIRSEGVGKITMRDLLFTPRLDVFTDGPGGVKCDVNTERFRLYGDRASGFEGWVEAPHIEVQLRGASIATIGGVSEEAYITTEESAVFTGEGHRSKRVSARADSKSRISIGVAEFLNATATSLGQILYLPLSEITVEEETMGGGIVRKF